MSRQPFARSGIPSPPTSSTASSSSSLAGAPSGPTSPREKSSKQNGPSFLSKVGLSQPTLKLSVRENILFLHPTPKDQPAQDPVLQGTVTLYLPKKRTLNHLTVRLTGRQDISWGDSRPYESNICLDKEVALFSGKQEVTLDKGEHTFAFSIICPSSTACCEKCLWGRVRHTVVAKAKGLGQLGSDVLSPEKPLFLIVNPGGSGANMPPPPLDHKFEGMLDDLGPYTMALQSQHIMVSGLLLFRFHLISPPAHVVIYSVKIKINQHFTILSPSEPKRIAQPPTDVRTVILLDGSNPPNFGAVQESPGSRTDRQTSPAPPSRGGLLKVIKPEEEYRIHHLGRLPNDAILRPTTQEWTESAIRVNHDIAMEVTYRVLTPQEIASGVSPKVGKDAKGKEKERVPDRKKLVVAKPMEIFSCCCFVDSLTLPPYSYNDPTAGADAVPECLCGMNTEELIDCHGRELMREEGELGFTYAPIIKSGPPTPSEGPVTSNSNRGRPYMPASTRSQSHELLTPPMRSPSSNSPTAQSGMRTEYFGSDWAELANNGNNGQPSNDCR